MRKFSFSRGRIAALSLALASLSAVALPGPASAAPRSDEGSCTVVLSKDRDPQGDSKVLAKACSTVSAADAHAKATAAATRARGGFAPADLILLQEYTDADYKTLSYTFVAADPCDSSGYTLTNYYQVGQYVSSMRGSNGCARAVFTDYADWTDHVIHALPINYLGEYWNDNVNKVHFFN
ncbi:hypothetical protein OG738_40575 [Amycolatopsis sp. NBC_01488]|uniref:hypothetical protein n=1 Tax=Amycolatopsis sp. NBC_01488 TaxID=2903563 RepID=UPI002E29ED64|nr:hypothetical protein [Amycolatopsis sp. NBC_01488]